MNVEVNVERCEQFGLDPRRIASIARRISRAAKEAQKLGIKVFGGAGSGTLRVMGEGGAGAEVATLAGCFDGGDGGDE